MKIRLLSDLHIEFGAFEATSQGVDLVVLAGDLHLGTRGVEWIQEQRFSCPVIYVLGNHEHYGSTYPKLTRRLKAAAGGGDLFVLEKERLDLDGVAFHCTTLWSDFALFGNPWLAGNECQQYINDFRKIRLEKSYAKMTPVDAAALHRDALKWLGESLIGSAARTNVVVTHHAPLARSLPEKYTRELTAAAYASDLGTFIVAHHPDYWLHGHIHTPVRYTFEGCQVICNPRGYPGEESRDFDPGLIIELDG